MFCEITVKIVQGLPRTTFYSENKIFLLTHFQPMFHYASRKHQKTFDFFMFSGGIGGFKWNIGCELV